MNFQTIKDLIDHLRLHQSLGHRFPDSVIDELEFEQKTLRN